MNDNLPQFMTMEEAAQRLKVSTRTLYRYMRNKKDPFPVVFLSDRTRRIPWDQFDIWVEEHANVKYKKKGGI